MRPPQPFKPGRIVRLVMPYRGAGRGIYMVVYVYRNGWLGVVARGDGGPCDVPPQVCRLVEDCGQPSDRPAASSSTPPVWPR